MVAGRDARAIGQGGLLAPPTEADVRTNRVHRLAILGERGRTVAPTPRAEMDRDLVVRAREGDHDAFAELAGAAISRLDAAAWLILRDAELAKDAVQDALVRAWRDLPTLRDPDRFDAWLHRLLVHACIDEARRQRRRPVALELTQLDGPVVTGHESVIADRDQLERGFLRLAPEMRAVVVLHHYLDLPMPTVADSLGIPLGTAKSRLHYALGQMRAALDADMRVRPELAEGRPT
jgi:RNA polymerase sigma-70 factor (ECF subfamily)